MLLLEKYTHQGFELPIGAVFAAPDDVAEQLFASGVATLHKPEPAPETDESDADLATAALADSETTGETATDLKAE